MRKNGTGWLVIAVLMLICLNSALLALVLNTNNTAQVARKLATATCRSQVHSRVDANYNRALNMRGWLYALEARLSTAQAAADPVIREANLTAARGYHDIIAGYTFYTRPPCLDTLGIADTSWRKAPAIPPLPKVPAK